MQFSSEYQPMFLSLFIKNYILVGYINDVVFWSVRGLLIQTLEIPLKPHDPD